MNPNVNMAGMNPMGGPVGGAPMPMMNNGAVNPQAAQAAAAAAARQQQMHDSQRGVLNTYIYEYFLRYEMFDCARSLINSNQPVNVLKEGANRRRDENGNIINGVGDDPMDTDSKDDLDSKLPEDLPPPKLPMPASDTSFLYEWFCLFWDIYNAQRVKGGNGTINQYVAHTQQQSRMKQNQQQELLRQMRPNMTPQQFQMMRNMQNEGMAMNMKQGNLARAAMANNQNPQMQMLQQQAKQNQMQRDPSGMDPNRDRPSSPASGENAPSPSKRQRVDAPFNPNQAGGMMPNGRPVQGMPGQQMPGNTAAAQQMLAASGINPNNLNAQQFQNFANAPPAAQQKSIATYAQTLQQHHGNQMGGNKQMPNAGGPQGQGSPMLAQGPDGTTLTAFYNPNDMGGPGGIRTGPNGPQAAGSSNHALQDYQMQLMLLEQQNKKRLMMARQEQDTMGGGAPGGPGGPGGPPGPNGQPFPDTSPQAMRTGASPNPAEQMKRGTPQMNNSSVPSPVPEGGQSRGSPNPAMNFMGNHVDPNMNPHFFKGMDGNMQQMNGMRPPSSHPNQQPFSGQMNPQMMAARQQAAQQQQGQQGQPGQQGQQPQGAQGNPQQWQPGPNGQMVPPNMQQQSPQIQGTPQQRSMPPPSAPAATGTNANNRTTASPQQAAAAPPTPNQGNKAAPKKKENKNAKDKRAASQKKTNPNLNAGATPADNNGDQDTPAPATPITSANTNFKNGQNANAGQNGQPTSGPNAAPAPAAPVAATTAPPAAPVAPQGHGDPNQNGMGMDSFGSMVDFGGMELANPLQSGDVLNDFDFDSFLHDGDAENQPFDFNGTFSAMEGGEIGAE